MAALSAPALSVETSAQQLLPRARTERTRCRAPRDRCEQRPRRRKSQVRRPRRKTRSRDRGAAQEFPADTKIIICGSTLAGEEELLLNALPPDVITILAPRHPERFRAVETLLSARDPISPAFPLDGFSSPIAPGTVFLLDSIGELASVYSLADLAFVGGGLFIPGGHNPLEPAQFGVPVVMGPHYENFRAIVEKLLADDAIAVVEIKEIPSTFHQLLTTKTQPAKWEPGPARSSRARPEPPKTQ